MRKLRVPIKKAAAVVVILLLAIWFINRLIAWGGCRWYGYQTEREVRYAAFVGCMVQIDGNWYPRNEIRVVQ